MKYLSLTLFIVSTIFCACSSKIEQYKSYSVDDSYPDLSISDLNTSYYSQHRLQTVVTAPIADRYEKFNQPYIEFTKGVKVAFIDDSLKEKSTLTADYAVYYQRKKLWEARKNVVVINEDGTTLKTEQLFGDEAKGKIFSVKKVIVTEHDGTIIEGKKGFESNTSFTDYKFLDVNGVVSLQTQYHDEMSN